MNKILAGAFVGTGIGVVGLTVGWSLPQTVLIAAVIGLALGLTLLSRPGA